MTEDGDYPDWWEKNVEYKRQLDIPEYQPPRFEDSVYTHAVVDELEDTYDCEIRFVGRNSKYPESWHVEIDGKPVLEIGRHRDVNGNTVYEMNSEAFETSLRDELEDFFD